jgi:hypothetical protein
MEHSMECSVERSMEHPVGNVLRRTAKQVHVGAARVQQANATVDAPRQSFQHSSDRGIDKLVIVTLGVK